MSSPRKLERIVKGFANHRRIQIISLLAKSPELSVQGISTGLRVNYKTVSEHIRRLVLAGLVLKRYQGSTVRHKLSPLGIDILKFLRKLE